MSTVKFLNGSLPVDGGIGGFMSPWQRRLPRTKIIYMYDYVNHDISQATIKLCLECSLLEEDATTSRESTNVYTVRNNLDTIKKSFLSRRFIQQKKCLYVSIHCILKNNQSVTKACRIDQGPAWAEVIPIPDG